jgi:amino acid transporter
MRRDDFQDDEEVGFEMKSNAKHRYTPQWGHWSGPEFEDDAMFRRKKWQRLWDTFKRDPNSALTPQGTVGGNGRVFDHKTAAYATANAPLARRLKGRHLQMIAFGGSIGS